MTNASTRWAVTGCAGFIGSNFLEAALRAGDSVVGLDNFSTGHRHNLATVAHVVGEDVFHNQFRFIEGDIREDEDCREVCRDADVVLHLAAQVSVPESIEKPELAMELNVSGMRKVFEAAASAKVRRVVFASSSAVYGDSTAVPAIEGAEGNPLSPYAATKFQGEQLAQEMCGTISSIGLRFFNVVGPRQDPNGAYAAVIPRWIQEFLAGEVPTIFGDGETTRDFCPVAEVITACQAAAVAELPFAVCNVGLGKETRLLELFSILRDGLADLGVPCGGQGPRFVAERAGDVRRSCASIEAAQELLDWQPQQSLAAGLAVTLAWYAKAARL